MNAHVKAQDIAAKLVELKKQKRGIDKSVYKLEEELSEIFDSLRVECMEIDMGMLCRRRTDSGFEWTIEI